MFDNMSLTGKERRQLGGVGSIIGGIGNIFGSSGNPLSGVASGIGEGMQDLRDWEQKGEGALDPYMQNRQDILDQYRKALGQGADPADFLNQLMGQYQESPYLQNQIDAGTQAANRAAAASGMLGSGAEQQEVASRAQGLRAQDMQNYLDRALGLRSQYLGGLGGLEQQGFGGSEDIARMRQRLGEGLLGAREQQAAARAAAEKESQKQSGGLFGGIGGILGGIGNLF